MISNVSKTSAQQAEKGIGGQMLPYVWPTNRHGKPRHEKLKAFKSEGIFASGFTKGQCI